MIEDPSDESAPAASTPPADLGGQPQARHVRKRPVEVTVEFASAEQMVQTLEGPVPALPGDAIITGLSGERWPVGRVRFDAKYDPVPPVQRGQSGRYSPRPLPVLALQMAAPFEVHTSRGAVLQGRAGDWLLDYGDGSRGVVAADIFDRTYEPA